MIRGVKRTTESSVVSIGFAIQVDPKRNLPLFARLYQRAQGAADGSVGAYLDGGWAIDIAENGISLWDTGRRLDSECAGGEFWRRRCVGNTPTN